MRSSTVSFRKVGSSGEIYANLRKIRDQSATWCGRVFPENPRRVSGTTSLSSCRQRFPYGRALVARRHLRDCPRSETKLIRPHSGSLVHRDTLDAFHAADHGSEILPFQSARAGRFEEGSSTVCGKKESQILNPAGRAWIFNCRIGAKDANESKNFALQLIDRLRQSPRSPTSATTGERSAAVGKYANPQSTSSCVCTWITG